MNAAVYAPRVAQKKRAGGKAKPKAAKPSAPIAPMPRTSVDELRAQLATEIASVLVNWQAYTEAQPGDRTAREIARGLRALWLQAKQPPKLDTKHEARAQAEELIELLRDRPGDGNDTEAILMRLALAWPALAAECSMLPPRTVVRSERTGRVRALWDDKAADLVRVAFGKVTRRDGWLDTAPTQRAIALARCALWALGCKRADNLTRGYAKQRSSK